MARDLKLQVVLQGLDRASKPFREAGRSASGLGRDLKAARTELKGLQAQQSDISSFRALKGQTEQTGQAMQASRDKVRQLSQQLANTATPTKALNQQFQRAVREATALKAKHSQQQAELQGLRGKLNAAGISTRNLGQHERDLRTRITATNQAMAQQEARLKRITAQQQRLARAKQQYDQTQALAGSMAATGAGGLATGSGILYAGARMLAPGLDFDASMSKVQALTKQENGSASLNALRNQARELGASTQFTAGQAADAQGFLAMAGFKVDAIMASMPGMLALAKAGDAELADTADIASNILSGLGMQANEMGRLGDVLTATFGNSNTNLQMLGETMKYAAPIAKTYAVDLETVSAMAGKLGDAGIQGSMGGTALSAIMNRLAAPPKAAAKALEALGITTADAAGNMRPMPDILKDVYDKTKALGTATRGGYLKAIAGDEAVKGMSYLVDQAGSGALQSFIADLRQSEGSAERVSRVMGDNLRGDLDALSSAWANLGIELQTQQNGPLRGITQGITKVIGSVKTWVAENPALASQLVKTAAGFGLLMAGMGGLTLAMASILGPFAMVRYGLSTMTIYGRGAFTVLTFLGRTALPLVATGLKALAVAAMANPILAIITGIALGAALIYSNWGRIGPYFAGLWGEIKAGFSGGLSGIAATIINFSPLGLFHRALAGVLSYFGVDIPARFTDFGGMIMQGLINGITAGLGRVKDAITGAADSSIGWFKEKLGIRSPSRVFATLGDDTMAGLAVGLQRSQNAPLSQLTSTAKQLTAAGAITLATAGSSLAMDNRPPLGALQAPVAQLSQPAPVTIHVHPSAGMDEQALARLVAAEVTRLQHAQQVRSRSSLQDQE